MFSHSCPRRPERAGGGENKTEGRGRGRRRSGRENGGSPAFAVEFGLRKGEKQNHAGKKKGSARACVLVWRAAFPKPFDPAMLEELLDHLLLRQLTSGDDTEGTLRVVLRAKTVLLDSLTPPVGLVGCAGARARFTTPPQGHRGSVAVSPRLWPGGGLGTLDGIFCVNSPHWHALFPYAIAGFHVRF